jgi:lysophospholipase L1-like esterase
MGATVQVTAVRSRRWVAAWLAAVALVGTSLVGVAATPAEAAAVFVTPARVMPLGDSITWGQGGDGGGGYRPPLVESLVAGRYSSDMVGSQRSGPPQLYDRDHEGYRGYRIDQIAGLAATELLAYRPGFILLQIGTNDVLQQYELATAPDRLSALIDLITDTAPGARLVVASITPLSDPDLDADARAYNAAIPDIVSAKAAGGRLVSFLDLYPVVTVADLVDGIHPNQAGYNKMAAAWHATLVGMQEPPPPVSTRSCPCSIWGPGDAPALEQVSTTTAAEVGVKLRAEKDGFITGIRFYKGTGNTGTHVGSLWTAAGALLASATFTGETSSGWQQVAFARPVPVVAHTLYVASYYAPAGRYAADAGYFADREVVNSPVRLPSAGAVGGNGVISSGGPGFPTAPAAQHDTNYWVDVVFSATAADLTAPTAPTGLAVTSAKRAVDLSWSASTDAGGSGLAGYRVWRGTAGASGPFTALATTASTAFSDTGVSRKVTYWYRVTAFDGAGNQSAPSSVVAATPK